MTRTNTTSRAAAALGRKGGKAKSEAKAAAARANGAKGGRPRRADYEARLDAAWDCTQKGGGEQYQAEVDKALKRYEITYRVEDGGRRRVHSLKLNKGLFSWPC
jgi:hypothetical protein